MTHDTVMSKEAVHIRGLLRALEALDHAPRPKKTWERTAAARDEARVLATLIREAVPNLDELAVLSATYFAEQRPDIIIEGGLYYFGPDVFRTDELDKGYPDDSGQDSEGDVCKSWAALNGLEAEEQAFHDKVLLRLAEIRELNRSNKKRATAEKRATTRKRTAMFSDMLATA